MKRPTHCERVLTLLSDGQPHTHHELYDLRVIAHSRVSDLRKRGHRIACWDDTEGGEIVYIYQLIPSEREPQAGHPAAGEAVSQADPHLEPASRSETDIAALLARHGFAEQPPQLTLIEGGKVRDSA